MNRLPPSNILRSAAVALVLAICAVAGILAPRTAHAAADPRGGTGGPPLDGTLTVRVVLAGTTDPVLGAFVMVGPAEGDPFDGNIGFTDGSGEVVFEHPSLTGSVAVTAGDVGRAYATVFDLGVSELVLPLQALEPGPTALLGDEFLGIEVDNGFFCLGDGHLDVGLVFPAVSLEDALTGQATLAISPSLEPASTPLGEVAVPSNLTIPRQCELFLYYEKPSYHLRVPAGRRTLYGLSARASLTDFLDAETILDLVRALDFREMDLLRDVEITGDSDAVDLFADLPLSSNLTLEVSNGQPATTVLAAAGGRIAAPNGEEELIFTGADGFDPDLDGPVATLTLTTRPAGGELSDLTHGALVSQMRDDPRVGNGRGTTTALVRSGFTPPATVFFTSFFDIVELESPDDLGFSWTDVSSDTSPGARDLNTSNLLHLLRASNPDDPAQVITETRTYWKLYTRGNDQDLLLPALPPSAPTVLPDPDATPAQDRLDFSHSVLHLADDPDGFDYDDFAFTDAGKFGTHVSMNDRPLRCGTVSEITGLLLSKGSGPGEVVLVWNPSADMCHDTLSGRSYEVYAGDEPGPAVAPGSWPDDPTFFQVTTEDLDGNLSDESFTHPVPPGDLVLYLVIDRGLNGANGPAGHYGSY